MSLSAARPIVMAPAVPAADDARGESNFTKRVARFDTSAVLASITVNSAAGVADGWGGALVSLTPGGMTCNLAGEPGSMTVSSSGGVPRGGGGGGTRGGGVCRGGTAGCRGGAFGGLAGCRGGAGRDGAPADRRAPGPCPGRRAGPAGAAAGGWGSVCSASADQARVGGPDRGCGRVRGGRPACPAAVRSRRSGAVLAGFRRGCSGRRGYRPPASGSR